MNLTKLFETQKILRERIDYNEPDRFNKLILALLVELGECANEWRGFKFWSKNQEPKTKLLEEYVDGLHFVLELGIELDVNKDDLLEEIELEPIFKKTLVDQFNTVFSMASKPRGQYMDLFNAFVGLGEWLGFTWEEIEEAYYQKNQINHERQDNGY